MNCEYQPTPDGFHHCWRCGHKTRHRRAKAPIRHCCYGIGDKVKILLARVGITPRRWRAALVYLRLAKPGACCGCDGRKVVLNRFGDGVLRWLRSLRRSPASGSHTAAD